MSGGGGEKVLARGPSGALAPEILAYSTSFSTDRALLEADVAGSLAHVRVLEAAALVSRDEAAALRSGLGAILVAPSDLPPGEEDVHMAVESRLTELAGEAGRRLHTGRSRNDQVALDTRLYTREACRVVLGLLAELLDTIATRADESRDLPMPAYTHRQRAIPVTVGFWWASHGAALARDAEGFAAAAAGASASFPLYSGACAGTTLPLDRELGSRLLAFDRPSLNALDAVSDRDFALDAVFASAKLMLHLSRLSADLVDFASEEFNFVTLADGVACGSSMMPQKKNPDVFELIRGRAARPVGDLTQLFVLLKGLPSGYNRDLQEDKPPLISALATARDALAVLPVALRGITFRNDRLRDAVRASNASATDVAEALAAAGLPFRRAYEVVGRMVAAASGARKRLGDLTDAEAAAIDPSVTAEILAIARDPLGSPSRRALPGGPAPAQVALQATELKNSAETARIAHGRIEPLAALARRLL